MLAIQLDPTRGDGPDALVWTEVPAPSAGPDEVVVEVVAAGVNRADLMQRRGLYPPPPGASEIIGLECAGRVQAVGDDVTGWQVGDECVALLAGGGYAERVVVPAGQLLPPPPGVDLVTAAGVVEVAATVVSNLDESALRAGETLLVHGGAGGIGTFATQYGHQLGATVIATAGSESKLAHCRAHGADHALRYDQGDWVAAVRELGGADIILDPMGAKYLPDHVRLLRRGGRLVTIGMQGGRKGELDLGALLARNASVTARGLRGRPVAEKAAICAALAERVWPMIADGRIRTAPTTTIAMESAAQAHARLESGDSVGKIVLTTAG